MNMGKGEYTVLRRMVRGNGRYALRWMSERQARVFRRLLSQRADWMEKKVEVMGYLNGYYIPRGTL